MSKVVVNLGYRSIVVDARQAIALAEVINGAEVYESKYHSAKDDNPSFSTHHVYPMTQEYAISMQLMTDEAYRMYKLAGKPDNN
jgi:hypothetical protein